MPVVLHIGTTSNSPIKSPIKYEKMRSLRPGREALFFSLLLELAVLMDRQLNVHWKANRKTVIVGGSLGHERNKKPDFKGVFSGLVEASQGSSPRRCRAEKLAEFTSFGSLVDGGRRAYSGKADCGTFRV